VLGKLTGNKRKNERKEEATLKVSLKKNDAAEFRKL
jgi:hypothetical protein